MSLSEIHGNINNFGYQSCTNRQIQSEDTTKELFSRLYEELIFSTPENREKAIRMLIVIYGLPIVF